MYENGLSYFGKETQPKLCKSDAKLRAGIRDLDLEQNKHQLLHRIRSIQTSLIYNRMAPYTECVTDLDLRGEMISFKSIWTTLNSVSCFKAARSCL